MAFTGKTFLEFRVWLNVYRLMALLDRWGAYQREHIVSHEPMPEGRGPDKRYEFIDWLYDVAYVRYCRKHGLEPGPFDVDLSAKSAEELLKDFDLS